MLEEEALQLLHALVVGGGHLLLAQRVAGVIVDGEGEVEAQKVHQLWWVGGMWGG